MSFLTMPFPLGWSIPFAPFDPSLDRGLKEIDNLCFYTYGDYLLPLSLLLLCLNPSLKPKSQIPSSRPILKAQIPALRTKF